MKCAAHTLIFGLNCSGTVLWIQLNHWFLVVSSFGSPNKVLSLSQRNPASSGHGAGGSNNTTARIKITPSFIAFMFVWCYANLPTSWRRHVGVCLNERFRGAWQSLNFYKEYLFWFETLIFATLQISYMHTQLVTPKTKDNMISHHVTPLKPQCTKDSLRIVILK